MLEIFISFAPEDRQMYLELEKHLSNLKHQKRIHSWSSTDLLSGADIEKTRLERFNAAHIILLLISADFMASSFCYTSEMMQAVARHEVNQTRVIPLLLRPMDYENAPFAKLAPLPSDGRAVTQWESMDGALNDVVKGIKRVITELEDAVPSSPTHSFTKNRPSPFREPEPVFSVPFPANRYFTGRENILNKLHEKFSSTQSINHRQAICGLGGQGKTQITIEYAHRFRKEYPYVFWLRADTQEVLLSDFASLVSLLHLSTQPERNQELEIEMVQQWLQRHDSWLLLLDNVGEIEDVKRLLPSELRGHVLLTTRTPLLDTTIQEYELTSMEPNNSIRFLLRRARIIEQEQESDAANKLERHMAAQLAEELGYLPLALVQAAAYIERTRCGLVGYYERYQARGTLLLRERGGLGADHPDPVATTWSLSFEKVEAAHPLAADLLRFCAFLHPDAIPETLLRDGASEAGELLQAIEEDIFILDEAIVELFKYSLIRRSTVEKENMLTIHRLVQVVLKDSMSKKVQREWAERTVRAMDRALQKDTNKTRQRYTLYAPHIQVGAALIAQWNIDIPEALQLLSQAGQYLHTYGAYRDAELLQQQLLTLQKRKYGENNLDVASTLNELGELARLQGHYPQAKLLYEQALSLREQIAGFEDTQVAISLNNLARSYYHLALFPQAESFYKQALAIFEQKPAAENYAIAHTLNDLATLYSDQKNFVEAEVLYQRALTIRKQAFGSEHPDTAKSQNNLATLYDEQERHAEAAVLYRQALAIYERVLGPEHPTTAASLNNLANLQNKQGRYGEAKKLYQRALAIREQTLGPEHPDTAISLNNLASVYYEQGNYARAKTLIKRALVICEKVLGPEHPDIAMSLNNFASVSEKQGNYLEAKTLYQRALAIREQVLGPGHPDTIESLNNLANLLDK